MVQTKNFNIEKLSGDQRVIAEVIGIDAYLNLSKVFGGTTIYIAKIDKFENAKRDKEIYDNFNGYNYKELAKRYKLSERTIRTIISSFCSSELQGQMSLFEENN